jgi:hypothetical protein
MRGVIPGAMPGMLAWQFLFRLIQGIRKQFDAKREADLHSLFKEVASEFA